LPFYLFFQCVATKRIGEFNERLELSLDNDLIVNRGRLGVLNHDGRRGRWRRRWGRRGSSLGWYWVRVANPSPLFLNVCDIFNPGCDGFQSAMDRRCNS